MLKMAQTAQRKTGLDKLVMAGGVALNSVGNGRVMRETPFREMCGFSRQRAIQVEPWERRCTPIMSCSASRVASCRSTTTGVRSTARRRWSKPSTARGFPYQRFDDIERLLDRATDTILKGKVIGWFQGRFEWGPRALGSRSILADPRRDEMKEIVNTKIKFREPFRPFAPVILEERAARVLHHRGTGPPVPARSC